MKLKIKIMLMLFFFIILIMSNNSLAFTQEELEAYTDCKVNYPSDKVSKFEEVLENAKTILVLTDYYENGSVKKYVFLVDCEGEFKLEDGRIFNFYDLEGNNKNYYYYYDWVNYSEDEASLYAGTMNYNISGGSIYSFTISRIEDIKNGVMAIASNTNLIDLSSDEVLFQAPPQVKSLEEVTLEAQLTAKEMTQVTVAKELEELIPVGVMIMATMILVSLVAFFPHWKA